MAWLLALPLTLAWLLLLPVFAFHPRLRSPVAHRLGLVPPSRGDGPIVWLHGASAGDVKALVPLAHRILQEHPAAVLRLSCMTTTGMTVARAHLELFTAPFFIPFDCPLFIRLALRRVRPQAIVFECAELWPYLIRGAAQQGVALALQNGRFSERRMHRYRRLFSLFGNLLHAFRFLWVRDASEADRAAILGGDVDAIAVTGNTKFDETLTIPDQDEVEQLRRSLRLEDSATVWVFGSSHAPEEAMALEIFKALREEHPSLRLVLAPRHLERADAVFQLLERSGYITSRRSAGRPSRTPDIVLLDSMGELNTAYGCADVVTVGGSFMRRGGHNVLEPAVLGKPVVFGPDMSNVEDTVRALLGRGGLQVSNPTQLKEVLEELVDAPPQRTQLGELARQTVLSMRGAAARNAQALSQVLNVQADGLATPGH